jgi:hypothetical protein
LDRAAGSTHDGLWVLTAAPLDVPCIVWVQVMVAGPAAQRAVDQRFGPGLVKLTATLKPIS